MDWFINYVLPMILTVVSGVLVFLIGEMLNVVWLQPLNVYKIIKKDIAKALTYYANIYTNVIDPTEKNESWKQEHINASNQLRELSCELEGFIQTLSWIKIGIPKKQKLKEATELLMYLSNCMFDPHKYQQNVDNKNTATEIRKLLKIYGYKQK